MAMSYYHRAEQDFKTLIARPACSFLPHNSLGDCYRSQGNPEKALPPYLKALELLSALQHRCLFAGLTRQVDAFLPATRAHVRVRGFLLKRIRMEKFVNGRAR